MNVSDISYDFPQAAYLFFFIPLFLILFWLFYQYRQRILEKYAAGKKIENLLEGESSISYGLKVAGVCLAWLCLSLAFMQPKGNARYPESKAQVKQNINVLRLQPHEVIFLMDASASMSVLDGRLGQSRFENAKEIADAIISGLQGQSGSLYTFTSEVSKLSPPSMDYLFMRVMLRNMQINEGDASGTNLKAALQYFHEHYLQSSQAQTSNVESSASVKSLPSLTKTVIIFSDGGDNQLDELKGNERQRYIQEMTDLLGDVEKEKLRVFTVGTGTVKGGEIPQLKYEGKSVTSQLKEEILKALSEKGKGRYYSGNEYSALDIATDLAMQISKADVFAPVDLTAGLNPKEDLIYDLYFQYPLAAALLLFAFYLFLPGTKNLRQKNGSLPIHRASMTVLFLWFAWDSLDAVDQRSDQLRLGAAYFVAQDYPAAINIYDQLLNEDLSDWERSVVIYNLGTALITQGENEKGLQYLHQLPLNKNTSPLLAYRVRENISIANFDQGKSLGDQLQVTPPLTQDPFFKAINFFQQALDEIPLAQQAQCRLFQATGETTCPPNLKLEEMSALAKMGLAQIKESARHHLVQDASFNEGIPWLLTGLQLLEQDVQLMLENKMPAPLQASYQQFFKDQASSWLPLWQSLMKKNSPNQHSFMSFEKADKSFNAALKAMDVGDFKEAKKNLTLTIGHLNRLLRHLFAADPFQEVISKLLNDFSLAALQEPLEANTLLFIQQKINEITIPAKSENIKENIEGVKNNIEQSLASIQKQEDIMAHLFFNEAWQELKRISQVLKLENREDPEMVLENAIDEQRHALAQARYLSRLIEKQEAVPKTVKDSIIQSQLYLLNYAAYFYDAAYARAVKEFTADVSPDQEDLRCQYHPWNEVFPLFQKGMSLAEKTGKKFKAQAFDLNLVMQNQEEVLNLWNQALAKLREPKQKGSCHATPLMNQPQQEGKPPSESFEDVARLIQQMDNDDQAQQPASPSSPLKKGLKPW